LSINGLVKIARFPNHGKRSAEYIKRAGLRNIYFKKYCLPRFTGAGRPSRRDEKGEFTHLLVPSPLWPKLESKSAVASVMPCS
jgi:hypothetical protein